MKINRDTVLIKAHYFMFFAGMVPVLPFFMVLGLGLGVPIALQGLLASVVLIGTVIAKPLLSLMADVFPACRKIIFISSVLMSGLSLGSICFVPPFGLTSSHSQVWLLPAQINVTDKNFGFNNANINVSNNEAGGGTKEFGPNSPVSALPFYDNVPATSEFPFLDLSDTSDSTDLPSRNISNNLEPSTLPDDASVDTDWLIQELTDYPMDSSNLSWSDIVLYIPHKDSCSLVTGVDCQLIDSESDGVVALLQIVRSSASLGPSVSAGYSGPRTREAVFNTHGANEGSFKFSDHFSPYSVSAQTAFLSRFLGKARLECRAGTEEGAGCEHRKVWTKFGFWAFFFLMMIGMIAFCTANSFTDAVTVETIGPTGNYGSQRAWGSIGWGVMGPVSGLLVDWWSGPAIMKDYTPAFLLVFLIMGLDTFLSANLKVPKLETEENIWTTVLPLLRQPRFLLFLFFSVITGSLDGVVLNFLFVLQEEMAAGSDAMQHIKFLQGVTIFVQCATEVPCMFLSHKLVKRIGADRVMTVVLALQSLRLMLITCVGKWGRVWLTVLVEVLNGPCYGLGYSAIVVYAGHLAPPGTSTTVQSLANICYESIGYALCTLLSGLLVSSVGSVHLFLVWGVISLVTTALHLCYVCCCSAPVDPLLNPPLQRTPANEAGGTIEEQLYLQPDGYNHNPTDTYNFNPQAENSSDNIGKKSLLHCRQLSNDSDTESEWCESARDNLKADPRPCTRPDTCHCIRQSGVTIALCELCVNERAVFLNGSVVSNEDDDSVDVEFPIDDIGTVQQQNVSGNLDDELEIVKTRKVKFSSYPSYEREIYEDPTESEINKQSQGNNPVKNREVFSGNLTATVDDTDDKDQTLRSTMYCYVTNV